MKSNVIKPDLLSVIRKTVDPNAGYGRSICCPFHNEKDPSLHIFKNQSWYCFGCGKGGDVYDFLGFLQYGDVWNHNNSEMFLSIMKNTENDNYKMVRVNKCADEQNDTDLSEKTKKAFLWAAKAYHQTLMSEEDSGVKAARDYLYGRGITDKTFRKLKIGYAGVSELHKKGLMLEPAKRTSFIEIMKETGFIRNGREYFTNRIIFPNVTKNGEVLNFTGRAVSSTGLRYLNLPNLRKNLYLLDLADPEQELFLTESVTDAVSLHQLGYSAAAVNGTALTERMKRSLEPFRNIIIVPQNDKASMNAACSWCESIPRCRIMLPEYIDGEEKDVNDILRLEGERQCEAKLRTAADNLLDLHAYAEKVREKLLRS